MNEKKKDKSDAQIGAGLNPMPKTTMIAMPEKELNEVFNYLSKRPWNEVQQMIDAVQRKSKRVVI